MTSQRRWIVTENDDGTVTLTDEGRNVLSVESELPEEKFAAIVRLMAAAPVMADALQAIHEVIEQTYAHDEAGNRTDGDCPISGADVVDLLAEQEPRIADALAAAGLQPIPSR